MRPLEDKLWVDLSPKEREIAHAFSMAVLRSKSFPEIMQRYNNGESIEAITWEIGEYFMRGPNMDAYIAKLEAKREALRRQKLVIITMNYFLSTIPVLEYREDNPYYLLGAPISMWGRLLLAEDHEEIMLAISKSLKKRYDATPLYLPMHIDFLAPMESPIDTGVLMRQPQPDKPDTSRELDPGLEHTQKWTWVVNLKSLEILIKALELGCGWAEGEISKISLNYPKEPPCGMEETKES